MPPSILPLRIPPVGRVRHPPVLHGGGLPGRTRRRRGRSALRGSVSGNGVIVFHPPTPNPDAETGFIETGTLPEADHALCAAAPNDFLRRYE